MLTPRSKIDSDAVNEISGLADDAYRNQWITFGYADISGRLRALVGDNATWFTFARWSSYTVGENLRGDKASAAFDVYLAGHPLLKFVRGPLLRFQQDLRLKNDAAMPRMLALGNRLVFKEIGFAATKLLEWHAKGGDPEAWPACREKIVAETTSELFERGELAWLHDGIECYFAASQATGDETKSDLVLRGNVLLAAYEQWRLSPVLKIALDPIAKHLVDFRIDADSPYGEVPTAVLKHEGTVWALRHRSPVRQWAVERYAGVFTRTLLAWEGPVPGPDVAPVFLGKPIPALRPASAVQPTEPETRNLLAMYDRSGAAEPGYGTNNWARFADRMNAVVNLFRSQQRNRALFAPLSPTELRVLDLDLSDANLDRARKIGDDEMEKLVAEHCSSSQTDPRQLVRELVDTGLLSGPTARVAADLPGWKNDELLMAGQRFMEQNGLEIAAALFTASLPYSYTAARGAEVLVRTAQLASGHMTRRIAETGQLLLDLMTTEDPPFVTGTQASTSLRGVRLFHEAVRQMILQSRQPWDSALGVPINQEDLFGTLIVFTVVALDALEQLGVVYTEQEADAYVHMWLVAGHLLGIDYSVVRRGMVPIEGQPLTLSELRLIGISIARRQAATSPAGATLMASLLRMSSAQMPPPFERYPTAATRRLIGTHYADMLEIGHTGSGHIAYNVLRFFSHAVNPLLDGKVMGALTRLGTKNLYRSWIKENRGDRPPWRLDAVPKWRLTDGEPAAVKLLRRAPIGRARHIGESGSLPRTSP